VPRFHLRGFASDGGQLRQIDLDSGRQALVSIDDATVVKDFYTVVLADGTHSDVWETRLADLEAAVAPAVRRAIDAGEWRPSSQERTNLASWIALQYLRGISNRRLIAHTRAQLVRMQVGMGGLGYLRHAMRVGLDRDVSEREAEAVWNDIHKPGGPTIRVSGDEHVASIAFSFEKAVETIGGRSWHRVRFTRRRLAINDTPVALIPGADHPSFLGLGLANASAITVALDRRTLLWLDYPVHPDFDFPASTQLARAHNSSVVFGAERFVYTHPDDEDPTAGLPLPRPPREYPEPSGIEQFANRDRPLEEVLKQIAGHDDRDPDVMIANYTWPFPGYEPPTLDDA